MVGTPARLTGVVILVFILGEDFNDVGCGTFQGLAGAKSIRVSWWAHQGSNLGPAD